MTIIEMDGTLFEDHVVEVKVVIDGPGDENRGTRISPDQ